MRQTCNGNVISCDVTRYVKPRHRLVTLHHRDPLTQSPGRKLSQEISPG